MYYTKVETYQFDIPREYRAYLKFKDDLKASGIKFLEDGGSSHQIITIHTNGTFISFNTAEEVEQ